MNAISDRLDGEETVPRDKPEGLCPHFGTCGGCQSQDVPYEGQLRRKEAGLQALLESHWRHAVPIEPSPVLWHYRNKMDFTFGLKYYETPPPKGFPRETVLGFKRQGRYYWPLEIHECRISSPEMTGLLAGVSAWAREQGLQAFHPRSHRGFLKILLVREGKRTGERMVALVTRPGELDTGAFVEAVLDSYPATSVCWAVSEGLAQTAQADTLHVLHGKGFIHEELHVPDDAGTRQLRFRISPMSFFQTNTLGAERLYGLLRRFVRAHRPRRIYDLYGGSGGIALACADLAEEIVSVENEPAATQDGEINADFNGIGNVRFVTEKVEDYLRARRDAGGLEEDALVICDPPRAGLHPKALRRLLEMAPPRIVYVSCKPEAFAQEMDAFSTKYVIEHASAVDMFPHTRHVELVAQLARQ